MGYRLLATDLDGTLFGPDVLISQRVREALGRWTRRGHGLVIATGRMFRSTRPIALELGVTTPLICYQGALIRDPETLADLWHRTLEPAIAREAIAVLEAAGFAVQLFRDDALHVTRVSDATRSYTALSKVEPIVLGSWDALFAAGRPTKIVAIAPREAVERQVVALRERFGDRLYVVQSQPTFLEIADPSVNKGAALAYLAERLGVPMNEVVAVGDGQNDLDMIRAAGLGVAMGGGNPELRATADRLTGSLAEDGVAQLIDALIDEGLA